MRIFAIALSLLASFFISNTAYAATQVSGTLNGNHVWTTANSPYVVTGTLTIPSDSTLTIEPGTVIKMNGVFFAYIYGALNAVGTALDPIIITSIHDDTAGGDTNENGALTVPTQGDWLTLYFLDGSRGAFTNTDIRYGGRSNGPSNPTGQIWNQGGDITIAESRLTDAQNFHILQNNGTTTVTDSIIRRAIDGVRSTGGSITSMRNTFVDNGRPLFVSGGTLMLESNNFGTTGPAPFVDASVTLTNHGGNTGKGLSINGTITGSVTWYKDSMPYVITDTVTVPVGASLTIEPGTVMKMEGFFFFYIYGTLTAGGTALDPITITSLRDDTVGGDTNGDGALTTPVQGDWLAFYFLDESHGSFVNVHMRYGGHSNGPTMPLGQIQNQGGIINVASSTLSDSANFNTNQSSGTTTVTNSTMARAIDGIHSTGGNITSTENIFVDNVRPLFVNNGILLLRANNFGTTGVPSFVEASVDFENHGDNLGGKGFAIKGTIAGHAKWPKDSQPYLITSTLTIPIGTSLSILPGAVVKMDGVFFVYIYGILKAGTATATYPVVITSLHDDTVGGDTSGDGALTTPAPGDWLALYFLPGSQGTFSNVQMRYGGRSNGPTMPLGQILNQGGSVTITKGTFSDSANYHILETSGTTSVTESTLTRSRVGIFVSGGALTVHDSSIHINAEYGVRNMTLDTLDATGNWWGSFGGPTHTSNPFGVGDRVSDNVDYGNWLTEESGALCATNCNSNVLFLPGLEASRLYRPDYSGGTTRLWEPEIFHDNTELFLDEDGVPHRDDIYTKDILDNAYLPIKGNIYASFIDSMNDMKSDGLINNWKALPYDWRLSPEEILNRGSDLSGGRIYYSGSLSATATPYIIQELRRLAATSRTGKVTIIAHSNGGLVAKALTDKLGAEAASLIDQIIFVAVPQVGTPQAIGAILHGYEQGLPTDFAPIFITPAEARILAKNMPSAYNLLPSFAYFTYVEDAAVAFDNSALLAPWRARYGNNIHSGERLHTFIADQTRITLPIADELLFPISGNETLLTNSEQLHDTKLDNWTPPAGITLSEIAGWGEMTLKTIEYYQGRKTSCTTQGDLHTCTDVPALEYRVKEVMDGDGTVVVPSALWTPGANKYWVDLSDYGIWWRGNIDRKHADILEVEGLRTLIQNLITKTTADLPKFISSATPTNPDPETRLRFTLHSPLSLHLYDNFGNHTGISTTTGILEENIPSSRYKTYGELKYIEAPASTTLRLVMNGYATGSFALDIEKKLGEVVVASTTFAAIPSSTTTTATITIPQGGSIADASPLSVDVDGNGTADIILNPVIGNVVLPDFIPPQTVATTSGTLGTNNWYTSNVAVTLFATDTGSGVQSTQYSLNGGVTWSAYLAPFTILNEGSTTLLYYSLDNAGNREATSSLIIKIDKTAPKASISVDPTTKDLKIEGSDTVGITTTVKNGDTYTITDVAGHTTKLFFQKTFTGNRLTYAKLTKMQYDNGTIVTLPSSYFVYLWQVVAPQTLLSQTIAVNDTYVVTAVYDKTKNKTTVLLKKKGAVVQTQQFTGLRIVKLTVNNGVVGYEI